MSESNDKQVGIPDEALPADLVPADDNPLAKGLPPGETVEGLLDPDPDAEDAGQDGTDPGKNEEDTAYAPAEGTGGDGERADPPPPEESPGSPTP